MATACAESARDVLCRQRRVIFLPVLGEFSNRPFRLKGEFSNRP